MQRIEDLLEMRVERTPDEPFLTVSDETYTFREVRDESKRYANALADLGAEAGDRVSVFLPNRSEFVFLLFANAYANSVMAPSNPEYQPSELRHSLELSGADGARHDARTPSRPPPRPRRDPPSIGS